MSLVALNLVDLWGREGTIYTYIYIYIYMHDILHYIHYTHDIHVIYVNDDTYIYIHMHIDTWTKVHMYIYIHTCNTPQDTINE